jgi:uncharacterized membrane protein YvbJ
MELKKCPYCGRDVEGQAKDCCWCLKAFVSGKPQLKWYLRTQAIVAAFLIIGPLGLPLVWLRPDLNRKAKITITVIILVVSYFLIAWSLKAVKSVEEYYQGILRL